MEMYVDEEKWNKADRVNQNLLNFFIKRVEHHMQERILIQMMNKRFKAFERGKAYIFKKSNKIKEVITKGLSGNVSTKDI